jgi:hypothetical protein
MTLELARMWLRSGENDNSHSKCHQFSQNLDLFMPTRLIDLGQGDTIAPRIFETSALSPETRYATLSHCWGGQVAVQLKKRNLMLYVQRLPDDLLPRAIGRMRQLFQKSCILLQNHASHSKTPKALIKLDYCPRSSLEAYLGLYNSIL